MIFTSLLYKNLLLVYFHFSPMLLCYRHTIYFHISQSILFLSNINIEKHLIYLLILCIYTYLVLFIPYVDPDFHPLLPFSFCLMNYLNSVLWFECIVGELFQLLYVWKSVYFTFIFERFFFSGYRILSWQIFSPYFPQYFQSCSTVFSHDYSIKNSHSLEKSALPLIFVPLCIICPVPLCIICPFSLAVFSIFSLVLVDQFD